MARLAWCAPNPRQKEAMSGLVAKGFQLGGAKAGASMAGWLSPVRCHRAVSRSGRLAGALRHAGGQYHTYNYNPPHGALNDRQGPYCQHTARHMSGNEDGGQGA